METFDVVQVGYGPVGQATAALLGRRGHRVAVFERQASLYGLPRVGGVDHEIMRILQSLEVAGEFEARTYPARGFDFLSAAGKTLVHLDWNHTGESGWGLRSLVYQPDLEDALDRAVRSQPTVELNQGWEAVRLEQHEDHVELTVEQRDTGLARTVRARDVVGADGASSFVGGRRGVARGMAVVLVPPPVSGARRGGSTPAGSSTSCPARTGRRRRRPTDAGGGWLHGSRAPTASSSGTSSIPSNRLWRPTGVAVARSLWVTPPT